MTRVTLVKGNRRTVRIRFEGHAGTAPAGEDLVCAAMSTLWCTLAAAAAEHSWDGEVRENAGMREMEIHMTRSNRNEVWLCLGVILAGVKLLARDYPEAAQYRELYFEEEKA